MKSKNRETLVSFYHYCSENPEQRFWQALRNWSSYAFIYGSSTDSADIELEDTFYKKGK